MPLQELIEQATKKLQKLGFSSLDQRVDEDRVGGERHGGWDWTWVKLRDQMRSYVSLTEIDAVDGTHRVQVWAGADNSVHFGRYLVREFPWYSDTDADKNAVVESLGEAARRATVLSDATLTGTYIQPIQ